MLNVRIVCVGKIKDSFNKQGIDEYKKRLSRYIKLDIIEVDDAKIKENASQKEEEIVKKEEGIRILKQVKDNEYMILLDLHGKEIDSVEFSKIIDMTSIRFSTITFVIGGSLGLSDAVIQRANYRLCLSKMTFTHQMTRVILLEQIYRSFKILNNEVYHK
jgi:23S rRNA (pseudouridine1915-N3)-methyltransferase